MGSIFLLVRNLPKNHHASREERVGGRAGVRTSPGQLVLSQKALILTLMVVLGVMAFSYLMLVNGRVTKAFGIKTLEEKLTELQKTQKQLERESANLQSIKNIEQSEQIINYTPTQNMSHLKNSDKAVTVK
ncbi:MAG: hypothetical protein AAB871_03805 [Patescibacteria group bacterium]